LFGITKAITNYFAANWRIDLVKNLLYWMVLALQSFILIHAASWNWVIFALLGISQD
jgi:hypothetical protein